MPALGRGRKISSRSSLATTASSNSGPVWDRRDFHKQTKIAELAMRLSGRDQAYLTADPGFNSQENK